MTWTPDLPIVALKDVRKSFGDLEVLKGVSFDVMKGEVICIIGPSGSGKSTLIRCINGLNDIQAGSIKVEGQEVHDAKLDKLELRKKVGMVFQQYNLFPHKTALENVMMAPVLVLKQNKAEVEERARKLLAKVRLQGKEDSYPGELSGGQQQMVAIGRALMSNPELILFDEISLGLAPIIIKSIYEVLPDIIGEGMSAVIVEQDIAKALSVAGRVYCMQEGRISLEGRSNELTREQISAAYFGV